MKLQLEPGRYFIVVCRQRSVVAEALRGRQIGGRRPMAGQRDLPLHGNEWDSGMTISMRLRRDAPPHTNGQGCRDRGFPDAVRPDRRCCSGSWPRACHQRFECPEPGLRARAVLRSGRRRRTLLFSPDGANVAFTVTTVVEEENRRHREIWLQPLSGGRPVGAAFPGYQLW